VQPMVRRPGAEELIAGVSIDPVFGPVVVFGAGGTSVEIVDDTATGLAPLDDVLAADLVDATRVSRLLAGYRDRRPADRTAITRMAAVPGPARDALFTLEGNDLNVLARNLSETELTTLASYLEGLEKVPRERVLRAVATSPSKMQVLARERVRDAIIASPDQSAAVAMMLETNAAFSPRAFAHDVALAAEGRVDPRLILDKHPGGTAMLAGLFLILVLWLGRLFRRPRAADTLAPAAAKASAPPSSNPHEPGGPAV
ncbi:MAG: acetate--CoA ligase family protein, partial [Hyphomicrobium sp.]